MILLLPNTKGNERLAKLTSVHTKHLCTLIIWHLLATNKISMKALMENSENHVMGEKGCGLIQTRY